MEKRRVAVAVGEQEEGMTEFYVLTSFYLAEYDVDYTANHHQSIEDVPGVPDIALNMAACTASRRRGGRQERRVMQESIRDYSEGYRRVTIRNQWKDEIRAKSP